MDGWADGESLIGRVVVDAGGRRLGRAVAVIHKAGGLDVLVEERSWFRARIRRFRAEELVLGDDGRLRAGGAPRRTPAPGVPVPRGLPDR